MTNPESAQPALPYNDVLAFTPSRAPNMSHAIAILAQDPNLQPQALALAQRFGLPQQHQPDADYELILTPQRLELEARRDAKCGPIYVDWARGRTFEEILAKDPYDLDGLAPFFETLGGPGRPDDAREKFQYALVAVQNAVRDHRGEEAVPAPEFPDPEDRNLDVHGSAPAQT